MKNALLLLFVISTIGCLQPVSLQNHSAAMPVAVQSIHTTNNAAGFLLESPYENGVSLTQWESSLSVEGQPVAFSIQQKTTQKNQATPYGPADVTEIRSNGQDIAKTTWIYALKEQPGTFVIQHEYVSDSIKTITQSTAFTATLANTEGSRLFYGPADQTVFFEDYINLPAIPGYEKQGNMIHGGTPLNYVWNKNGGVAVGVLTDKAETFELPLRVRDRSVDVAVRFEPQRELKQIIRIGPGKPYATEKVFISFHKHDFFQPLKRYSQVWEKMTGKTVRNQTEPAWAKDPYWKTWGFTASAHENRPNGFTEATLARQNQNGPPFTQDEVRHVLPELKALNVSWVMLDYGWFTNEGNWQFNPEMFSDENDAKAFIRELKNQGFHVGLWYQPIQIDLSDQVNQANGLEKYAVKNQAQEGFIDDDGLELLNPAHAYTQEENVRQLQRFYEWGVEHVYLDSQIAQLYNPPDFSQDNPMAGHDALHRLYVETRQFAQTHHMITEYCPDGRSRTFLNMGQDINNAGDPRDNRQLRSKFKSLKALLGENAIVGAYVEDALYHDQSPTPDNFASIVGLGGQLQTYFWNMSESDRKAFTAWTKTYHDERIVDGEYTDAYDVGFDYPEAHVVQKGNTHYYSFFTQNQPVEACITPCQTNDEMQRIEPAKSDRYSGIVTFKALKPDTAYTATRIQDGSIQIIKTNSDGQAVLETSFTKEATYVVKEQANRISEN